MQLVEWGGKTTNLYIYILFHIKKFFHSNIKNLQKKKNSNSFIHAIKCEMNKLRIMEKNNGYSREY